MPPIIRPLPPDAPALTQQQQTDFVAHLISSGSMQKAADSIGVSIASVRLALSADPALWGAAESAIRSCRVAILEDEAMRRAVDGVEEPVFQGGQLVGTKRVYSDSLLKLMLQAADPARYGDSRRVDITSSDGSLALLDDSTRAARIAQLLAAASERSGKLPAPAPRPADLVIDVIPEPVKSPERMAAQLAKAAKGGKARTG